MMDDTTIVHFIQEEDGWYYQDCDRSGGPFNTREEAEEGYRTHDEHFLAYQARYYASLKEKRMKTLPHGS
jgi:hypothetical protein